MYKFFCDNQLVLRMNENTGEMWIVEIDNVEKGWQKVKESI